MARSDMRFLLITLVLWLSASIANISQAASVATPVDQAKVDIGRGIEYLEDQQGSRSFESVQDDDQSWHVSEQAVFNKGYNPSTWWLKFEVTNATDSNRWLLDISYAILDEVDLFILRGNGQYQRFELGDRRPFHQRPIDHRNFIVPLDIPPYESVSVFVRLKSSSSIQAPIALWGERAFFSAETRTMAAEGLFYGGLLIIAIYNLLLFFALRERVYLYYVAYVVSMFLFMASLRGWAFMWIWPESVSWNDKALVFFLNAMILFSIAFVGRLLDLATLSKHWRWSVKTLVALMTLVTLVSLLLPYYVAIKIAIPLAALACFWGATAGIVAWRAGRSAARYYAFSWIAMQVGGVAMILNKFDVIPRSVLTDYSLQWAVLMEVVLLSFALAERINHERAMRIQAQKLALQVQQDANEALEQRVAERTAELEELTHKFRDLSDTDQLTSLKNRRFLHASMSDELARSARYKRNLAVVFLDVGHFKLINDRFGHTVGDECLVELAKRLVRGIRQGIDLVARYGGEEFCLVLPETDIHQAAQVSERLRLDVERLPFATQAGDLPVTVSVGVYAAVPSGFANEDTVFFTHADEALYCSKQGGRNRVTLFNADDCPFSKGVTARTGSE